VAVDAAQLRPGDVIVTRTDDSGGWWIRRRTQIRRNRWKPWTWLADSPGLHNHVAMFIHHDSTGRPRGLEGRPGGFGWADLDRYLAHPDTIANTDQPKTDEQRDFLVRGAVAMVGIPYDWEAILAFASGTAGLPFLVAEWPEDGVPAHVVCSSADDYLYEGARLANPGGYRRTRGTDPDAWSEFIAQRLWQP
jgi:hypothetical protein